MAVRRRAYTQLLGTRRRSRSRISDLRPYEMLDLSSSTRSARSASPMSHSTFRSWSFSQLKHPLRRPQLPTSRLPSQPTNHGPRGHPPLPLPLSLLQSLTPMTLSSLVTGTARELKPAATPAAACLGTTSTAVLLRKSMWAPVVSRLSTAGFSCPPPSPYRAMAADSTPLATQCDAPPHATGYSFEIVVEPAISTGAYIMEETDSDT
ncbi:hypothetical protein EDB84DRAFT_1206201 [Lactarius hengduanensis]|nr:hypothetical protein EDB84DRAFT_1206201 [Lactarius hengduanensis]